MGIWPQLGQYTPVANSEDPVLVARAKVSTWASRGTRTGAALFAGSFVAFFFGLSAGFNQFIDMAATWCLILGSIVMCPSIIVQYTVKAANRADAESSW